MYVEMGFPLNLYRHHNFSPSFSSSHYIASISVISVSPPSLVTVIFVMVAIIAAVLRLLDALLQEQNEPGDSVLLNWLGARMIHSSWRMMRHSLSLLPSLPK
jgi:hypothetical protein